ncbi:MAG TPA: hypothetical protein VMR96_10695, partial [Solirubrobacterales bacterium]|nr:hypothetical protein [Solirubrobacterales bacterium]
MQREHCRLSASNSLRRSGGCVVEDRPDRAEDEREPDGADDEAKPEPIPKEAMAFVAWLSVDPSGDGATQMTI